jgi:hypothetical protein
MSQIADELKKFSDEVKNPHMQGWTPTTGLQDPPPFVQGITHLLNALVPLPPPSQTPSPPTPNSASGQPPPVPSRTWPAKHTIATIANLGCSINIVFRQWNLDPVLADAFFIEVVSLVQPPNNPELLASIVMGSHGANADMNLQVPNKTIHDALMDCGIRLGRIMQLQKIHLKQVDLLVTHKNNSTPLTNAEIPNCHIFFQLFKPEYFSNLPGNFAEEKLNEEIPDSKKTILYVKDFLANPPLSYFFNPDDKKFIESLISAFWECGTKTTTQASKDAIALYNAQQAQANAHPFSDKLNKVLPYIGRQLQKGWRAGVVKPISYLQRAAYNAYDARYNKSQNQQAPPGPSPQSPPGTPPQAPAPVPTEVVDELERPLIQDVALTIFSAFINDLQTAVNTESQNFYNAPSPNSTNINNNVIINPPTDRQQNLWPDLWDNIINVKGSNSQWVFPDLEFENIIFEIDPQNGTCAPNGGLPVKQNGGGAIRVGGGHRRRPHRSRHRRRLSRRHRLWSRRPRDRTQQLRTQQLRPRKTAKRFPPGYYYRKTLKRPPFV